MVWWWIALGGALGSVTRYALAQATGGWSVATAWPWGTFLANVVGSCALGFLFAAAEERGWLPRDLRLALGVGVLGGFTTYSSFNLEALRMLETGSAARGIAYVAATVVVCFAAGVAGVALGRLVPMR